MNPIKQAVVKTKNFVVNHKTSFAVAGTAIICGAIARATALEAKHATQFIADKDLWDEYIQSWNTNQELNQAEAP